MNMLKKGFRRLGLIMMTTALLAGSILPVTAKEPAGMEIDQFDIDLDKKGSITVGLLFKTDYDEGQHATAAFYKVADIVEKESVYEYQYTSDFAGSEIPIDQLITDNKGSRPQAQMLADFVKNNHIKFVAEANSDIAYKDDPTVYGKVDNLTPGAYLIVETYAPEGYILAEPTLVTVPYADPVTGEAVYDVIALTKLNSPRRRQPETKPETNPETKPETTPDTSKIPPKPLPQTGQLWWPVPILIAAGLLFVLLGILKRKDR